MRAPGGVDRSGELPHTSSNCRGSTAAESKEQGALTLSAAVAISGEWHHFDVARGRLSENAFGIDTFEIGNRMYARMHRSQAQGSSRAFYRGAQRMQPFRIFELHAAYVTLIVTARHEFRENHLIQQRWMHIARRSRSRESIDQVAGYDKETQTQGREQRLAEGSHVNNAAIGIECVQAR